jgi:hypothetical protein
VRVTCHDSRGAVSAKLRNPNATEQQYMVSVTGGSAGDSYVVQPPAHDRYSNRNTDQYAVRNADGYTGRNANTDADDRDDHCADHAVGIIGLGSLLIRRRRGLHQL